MGHGKQQYDKVISVAAPSLVKALCDLHIIQVRDDSCCISLLRMNVALDTPCGPFFLLSDERRL